jgi:hypothetical protein
LPTAPQTQPKGFSGRCSDEHGIAWANMGVNGFTQ